MELSERKRIKTVWDICLSIVIIIGLTLLVYSALNGDKYRFDLQEIKVITYVCIELLLSRLFFRLFKKRKNIWKCFWVVVVNLISTCVIFLFNNLLHYYGFSTMLGNTEDVKLYYFFISDLKYSLGLGIFRYILFFVLGVMFFVTINIADEEIQRLKNCSKIIKKWICQK